MTQDGQDNRRLPLAALLAVLVAFASEYATHSSPAIPLLAVILLISQFVPLQFESRFMRNWVVRIVIATGLYLRSASVSTGPWWLFDTQFTSFIADVCAAEITLQCWMAWPPRSWRGAVVTFYSSAMMILSTNAPSRQENIFIEAPIFIFLLGISFPSFFPFQSDAADKKMRLRGAATRAIFVGLVVIVGFTLCTIFWKFQIQLSQWGENLIRDDTSTRLGDLDTNPMLGSSYGLEGSTDRVLRVYSLPNPTYLRAVSYTIYANGQWVPQVSNRRTSPYVPTVQPDGTSSLSARIDRLNNDRLIVAPIETAWFGFGPEESVDVDVQDGGPIETDASSSSAYDLKISRDETEADLMNHPLTDKERAICLSLPAGSGERIREIAESIPLTAPVRPLTKVLGVERYLDQHHKYSLNYRPSQGDPVISFLNSDKPAHCEYFASAAALLLRALGLPTRYVVGYYAHESSGSDQMVVRGRDAHAWVECWIDGIGWTTVDATPGDGMPDHDPRQVPFWQNVFERIEDTSSFLSRLVTMLSVTQIVLIVASVGSGLIIVALIRRQLVLSRLRSQTADYTLPSERIARLMVRFDRLLAKGVADPCPETSTWERHVRLASLDGEAKVMLLSFIADYNRIRFGVPKGQEQVILDLENAMDGLEAQVLRRRTALQMSSKEEG